MSFSKSGITSYYLVLSEFINVIISMKELFKGLLHGRLLVDEDIIDVALSTLTKWVR